MLLRNRRYCTDDNYIISVSEFNGIVHGLSYRIKSVRIYSLILADTGVYWSLTGS